MELIAFLINNLRKNMSSPPLDRNETEFIEDYGPEEGYGLYRMRTRGEQRANLLK